MTDQHPTHDTDTEPDVAEMVPVEPPADQQTDTAQEPEPAEHTEAEPDTFPREYVEKLRQEAADHRVKAKDRDALAERLHHALVAATGRLADPTDLPFHEDHLENPDTLTAALDDLISRKPHLATRRPAGDIGQGVSEGPSTVNLAGILRNAAQ